MEYCIIIVDKLVMILHSYHASFLCFPHCLHRKIKGTICHLVFFSTSAVKYQQECVSSELLIRRCLPVMKLCKPQFSWVNEAKLLPCHLGRSWWNSGMGLGKMFKIQGPIFIMFFFPKVSYFWVSRIALHFQTLDFTSRWPFLLLFLSHFPFSFETIL
jgi:hypothetical protein